MDNQIAGICVFIVNIACKDVISQIHHTAVDTADEVGVFLSFIFHTDGITDRFSITLCQCSGKCKLIGQLGGLAVIKGDCIPIGAFHEVYRGVQTVIAKRGTGHSFHINTDILIIGFQITAHLGTFFF